MKTIFKCIIGGFVLYCVFLFLIMLHDNNSLIFVSLISLVILFLLLKDGSKFLKGVGIEIRRREKKRTHKKFVYKIMTSLGLW